MPKIWSLAECSKWFLFVTDSSYKFNYMYNFANYLQFAVFKF